MIASPAAYSPVRNPAAALERRNLVLQRMRDQYAAHRRASTRRRSARRCRRGTRSEPPRKVSKAPYFSSWVEDQLVERYGTGNTFGGGLKIRTTLDLEFQKAAEQAINGRLAGVGPSAALVAIDNNTGGVRAMVGGSDFQERPFNLATQGLRQPGSAFKPFTLIAALEKGISPGRTFASAPKVLEGPRGEFKVENYEDRYAGVTTLAGATDDVGQLGVRRGRLPAGRHARGRARRDGRWVSGRPISRNPAMVLGGLKVGRHAARDGEGLRDAGAAGRERDGIAGPVRRRTGHLHQGRGPRASTTRTRSRRKRVVPEGVADQATSDPAERGHRRHRPERPDRRVRRGQDRHHRELPGRLVRRLQRRR